MDKLMHHLDSRERHRMKTDLSSSKNSSNNWPILLLPMFARIKTILKILLRKRRKRRMPSFLKNSMRLALHKWRFLLLTRNKQESIHYQYLHYPHQILFHSINNSNRDSILIRKRITIRTAIRQVAIMWTVAAVTCKVIIEGHRLERSLKRNILKMSERFRQSLLHLTHLLNLRSKISNKDTNRSIRISNIDLKLMILVRHNLSSKTRTKLPCTRAQK